MNHKYHEVVKYPKFKALFNGSFDFVIFRTLVGFQLEASFTAKLMSLSHAKGLCEAVKPIVCPSTSLMGAH